MPATLPPWLAGRLQPEPTASRVIYNALFKHSSTYMTVVLVTATAAGLGYDSFMNSIWDANNKGVGLISILRIAADTLFECEKCSSYICSSFLSIMRFILLAALSGYRSITDHLIHLLLISRNLSPLGGLGFFSRASSPFLDSNALACPSDSSKML
eukprot:6181431-Pleurochrysis_carterae.AAC.1